MTTRNLTAGMLSAIQAGTVRPALLYEGEFFSGGVTVFLRLWTGVGEFSWDGKTWTGGGKLLSISVISETSGVRAVGFQVTVSGIPSAHISLALQSVQRNRPGRLWLALFDAAGAVIADPYLLKRGRFNMIPIQDDGKSATITASYEDRLIALNIPRERRYTHEDQQIRAPGDKGFDQVEALQDADFQL
jgi:hypothetical protein